MVGIVYFFKKRDYVKLILNIQNMIDYLVKELDLEENSNYEIHLMEGTIQAGDIVAFFNFKTFLNIRNGKQLKI